MMEMNAGDSTESRIFPLAQGEGNRFAFRVFGGPQYNENVAFMLCNISSFCFYVIQGIYCLYLLFRIARKTPRKPRRSCSLIAAILMILYSSIVLAFFFGNSELSLKAQSATGDQDTDIYLAIYLIMCRDLPFSLTFIAHQLILSQYYEMALILDVLVSMGKNWMEAGNKLMAKRYCIKATMIIVGAFIVAHFLDKGFYTI